MSSKGELTFATHGYAETLIRVLDLLKPTHICAAWDAKGPTFRHETSEAYKATRRPTPSDLLPQMDRVRQMLDAFNIPVYEMPGYEADDVAGTIARMAAEQGIETYIATLDTDLVQLIGPKVNLFMFRPFQKDTVDYNEKRAAERYGFSPIYMIDYKSLKGDTSDNIEGIKGIGEKTATDLIRQFGSVEEIYANLELIKSNSVREKLAAGRQTAFDNKFLVTIKTDLPVDFNLEACRLKNYDQERVLALFRDLEFRMLTARLQEVVGKGDASAVTTEADPTVLDYQVVHTLDELDALIARLRTAGTFGFHALSTAGDTTHPLLLGLSFAIGPGQAWYVPVGHAPRLDEAVVQPPKDEALRRLRPLLEDSTVKQTSYGSKYLMHLMRRSGVTLAPAEFDVQIAAFLLGETSSTLNALAAERLQLETTAVSTLTGTGRKMISLAEVELDTVATYANQQADLTLRLREPLEAQLLERDQKPLFEQMELPLMPVLYEMERIGVALDISVLRELSRTMSTDIDRSEREIYDLVGHEFNIGSPQQLSDILFKELGLPKGRKTTQGYSTDQRALEGLRPLTPIVDLIFEYRGLTKLKSTYCDSLPATVEEDGRIHTDFAQTVAATGRLSSVNPNLQNIPVRTDAGRDIRKAFIASYFPDPWFVAADYSQIELRVLAHVTEDAGLVAAFLADEDIHRATAATVYGVEPEAVTRQMRDLAKVVNFGIVYGMGEFGLSSRTELSREEAGKFIETYYAKYPGIRDWQAKTLASTKEKGYAETIFGRRRYLPAIRSSNFNIRGAAEREAVNMPIQGAAADIIKVAMIRVAAEMRERQLQSRMILQVHDELIFECPAEEVETVRELARRVMHASLELKVPLKVDLKQGRTWGAME